MQETALRADAAPSAARKAVCVEDGSFAVSLSSEAADTVEVAVLSVWSLVHGLAMLLIDGLAGARSA